MKKFKPSKQDIEKQLIERQAHLEALLNTLPDLIWLKDENGIYLNCNSLFEKFFGAKEEEIVGKTDFDFVDKELAEFFRKHDNKAMRLGKPSTNEEWVTFAVGGQRCLLETTKTPMYGPDGELIGILGIGHDITERRALEDELRHANMRLQELVSIDMLTKIANRRRFDEHMARVWKHCQREQKPLSLVLIDVDYFKQYNDYYGHAAGDECLVNVAQLLDKGGYAQRPNDLIARYGGEEFAIILSQTEVSQALAIAERFRQAVVNAQYPHAAALTQDLHGKWLTISAGIACCVPQKDVAVNSLFCLADQALYQAKAQGRNQCVVYGDEQ
ncbi:MAG: diguanylate cyclase [Exilibacterium sp.]